MERNNWIAQRGYWKYFFEQQDGYKLLQKGVMEEERACLFNKYVMVVSIETSSFCNRSCDYCPVGYDKKKEQSYLDNEVFHKLLDELSLINYKGDITVNLFNEPLLDRNIINKIKEIKRACPDARITMNSNGDYMSSVMLHDLAEAGLGQILLTCHTMPGDKYSHQSKKIEVMNMCNKIGVPYELTSEEEGMNITCDTLYNGVRVLVVSNNWSEAGVDRGGKVSKLSVDDNNMPCMRPFREMVIAHDGYSRCCVNIYTSEDHYGHVREYSLMDIYFSDRMVDLRRHMLCYGEKETPHSSCKDRERLSPYGNTNEYKSKCITLLKKAEEKTD